MRGFHFFFHLLGYDVNYFNMVYCIGYATNMVCCIGCTTMSTGSISVGMKGKVETKTNWGKTFRSEFDVTKSRGVDTWPTER